MGAYENMKMFLKQTGLYWLDGETLADCELKAYACAIDALADELDGLQNESFVNTSSGYGLENREKAFGLTGTGETADRRGTLLKLGAVTQNSRTKEDLGQLLKAMGMETEITEDGANGTVTVKFLKLPQCGVGKAVRAVNAFAPAHLTVKTDFSGAK